MPPGTQVTFIFLFCHLWATATISKVARWLLHQHIVPTSQRGRRRRVKGKTLSLPLCSVPLSIRRAIALGEASPTWHLLTFHWTKMDHMDTSCKGVWGHSAALNNNRLLSVEIMNGLVAISISRISRENGCTAISMYPVKKLRQYLSLCPQIWRGKRTLGLLLYNSWETRRAA